MSAAYREWPAAPDLAERLGCVWGSVVDGTGRVKRIVPDGCIDIIWSSHDEAVHVAGPDTTAFHAHLRPGERFAGVRFRPGAAAEVLGVPAAALRDNRVPLAELWDGDARRITDLVAAAADAPRALERLVTGRVLAAGPPDRSVAGVLRHLGDGRVHRLAGAVGLSERHLLRRCNDAFGYGPKVLHRVLRFQQALRMVRADAALADVAHRCGYADQAHLTREFRSLAGVPPSGLRP